MAKVARRKSMFKNKSNSVFKADSENNVVIKYSDNAQTVRGNKRKSSFEIKPSITRTHWLQTNIQQIPKSERLDSLMEIYEPTAVINQVNQKTTLHLAAEYGLYSKIRDLVENGADVNASDSNGETPIFHTIKHVIDATDIANYLLDSGADSSIRNTNGDSLIRLSKKYLKKSEERSELIKRLKDQIDYQKIKAFSQSDIEKLIDFLLHTESDIRLLLEDVLENESEETIDRLINFILEKKNNKDMEFEIKINLFPKSLAECIISYSETHLLELKTKSISSLTKRIIKFNKQKESTLSLTEDELINICKHLHHNAEFRDACMQELTSRIFNYYSEGGIIDTNLLLKPIEILKDIGVQKCGFIQFHKVAHPFSLITGKSIGKFHLMKEINLILIEEGLVDEVASLTNIHEYGSRTNLIKLMLKLPEFEQLINELQLCTVNEKNKKFIDAALSTLNALKEIEPRKEVLEILKKYYSGQECDYTELQSISECYQDLTMVKNSLIPYLEQGTYTSLKPVEASTTEYIKMLRNVIKPFLRFANREISKCEELLTTKSIILIKNAQDILGDFAQKISFNEGENPFFITNEYKQLCEHLKNIIELTGQIEQNAVTSFEDIT